MSNRLDWAKDKRRHESVKYSAGSKVKFALPRGIRRTSIRERKPYTIMFSKFAGHCKSCNQSFETNTKIRYWGKDLGATHLTCEIKGAN